MPVLNSYNCQVQSAPKLSQVATIDLEEEEEDGDSSDSDGEPEQLVQEKDNTTATVQEHTGEGSSAAQQDPDPDLLGGPLHGLDLGEKPNLDNVQIRPEDKLIPIGFVSASIDGVIVVKGEEDSDPIDLNSIVCDEERRIIGVVEDIFGQVTNPSYAVRPCGKDEGKASISEGTRVMAVPSLCISVDVAAAIVDCNSGEDIESDDDGKDATLQDPKDANGASTSAAVKENNQTDKQSNKEKAFEGVEGATNAEDAVNVMSGKGTNSKNRGNGRRKGRDRRNAAGHQQPNRPNKRSANNAGQGPPAQRIRQGPHPVPHAQHMIPRPLQHPQHPMAQPCAQFAPPGQFIVHRPGMSPQMPQMVAQPFPAGAPHMQQPPTIVLPAAAPPVVFTQQASPQFVPHPPRHGVPPCAVPPRAAQHVAPVPAIPGAMRPAYPGQHGPPARMDHDFQAQLQRALGPPPR